MWTARQERPHDRRCREGKNPLLFRSGKKEFTTRSRAQVKQNVQKYELLRQYFIFFFQAEDGIRDYKVTGVQTCALPIWLAVPAPHGVTTGHHCPATA